MKYDLLRIGTFPPLAQDLIDAEFNCHAPGDLDANPGLREAIRGIITRSNYQILPEVIASLPNLGIISTSGVGFDGIPLDIAAQRGIAVTNTPGILNSAVAELTLGMLLALLRHIPAAHQFVKSGRWKDGSFPLGTSLSGKRVGIVGLGRIGKEIASRLQPFGVVLSYYGRSDQKLDWKYESDLVQLARSSDILIVSSPGGRETLHMVNADVLEALGSSGFIVNVARSSVIDEEALLDALSRRTIAGAALDVFDNEPDADPRFFDLDNVVLMPHIGSATNETRLAMVRLTLDNLHRFFETGETLTPVVR